MYEQATSGMGTQAVYTTPESAGLLYMANAFRTGALSPAPPPPPYLISREDTEITQPYDEAPPPPPSPPPAPAPFDVGPGANDPPPWWVYGGLFVVVLGAAGGGYWWWKRNKTAPQEM